MGSKASNHTLIRHRGQTGTKSTQVGVKGGGTYRGRWCREGDVWWRDTGSLRKRTGQGKLQRATQPWIRIEKVGTILD